MDRARVLAAAQILRGVADETPMVRNDALDALAGGRAHFKLESQQRAGAFKFRGAFHAVACQREACVARGVVTGSSGNHGAALALAAQLHGASCLVVMPEDATAAKLANVRAAGGEVLLHGRSSDERLAKAAAIAQSEGRVMIPPYDSEDVMAGQGTCALEALRQVPDMEVFVAPCGGGGLLAGCAVALRDCADAVVQVFGAEAELANDTARSFQSGARVRIEVPQTIADGMRNVIPGALTFPLVLRHCAGIALVSEDEIRAAMRLLHQYLGVMVEPTAAVAPAALLYRRIDLRGRCAVAVVSGGNITAQDWHAVAHA